MGQTNQKTSQNPDVVSQNSLSKKNSILSQPNNTKISQSQINPQNNTSYFKQVQNEQYILIAKTLDQYFNRQQNDKDSQISQQQLQIKKDIFTKFMRKSITLEVNSKDPKQQKNSIFNFFIQNEQDYYQIQNIKVLFQIVYPNNTTKQSKIKLTNSQENLKDELINNKNNGNNNNSNGESDISSNVSQYKHSRLKKNNGSISHNVTFNLGTDRKSLLGANQINQNDISSPQESMRDHYSEDKIQEESQRQLKNNIKKLSHTVKQITTNNPVYNNNKHQSIKGKFFQNNLHQHQSEMVSSCGSTQNSINNNNASYLSEVNCNVKMNIQKCSEQLINKFLDEDNLPTICYDCSKTKLGLYGAVDLKNSMVYFCSLKKFNLNLNECQLGEQGGQILAKGLIELYNLTHLSLQMRWNGIGEKGAQQLGQSIKNLYELRYIDLNLYQNNIGDAGVAGIMEGLKNAYFLQFLFLNLNWNKVTDVGVTNLCEGILTMFHYYKIRLLGIRIKLEFNDISQQNAKKILQHFGSDIISF